MPTIKELKSMPFEMRMSLSAGDRHVLTYRNETYGVTMVVTTRKIKGQWGKQVRTFRIDGDEVWFAEPEKLFKALHKRLNASGNEETTDA